MSKHAGPSIQQIVRGRALPGLLLFNPHGKLLSLNPIARQILRRGQEASLLQPIRSLLRDLNKTHIKPKSQVSSLVAPHPWTIFSSGRRNYGLQVSLLDHPPAGQPRVVAVLLERINPSRFDLHKAKRLFGLSPRETEVIQVLQTGRTDKQIASALGIGFETVRGYLKNIRTKLGVSTRTAIINRLLSF